LFCAWICLHRQVRVHEEMYSTAERSNKYYGYIGLMEEQKAAEKARERVKKPAESHPRAQC